MEMKDVKVGMYVKLSIDQESKYQVVEKNSTVPLPITIRKFGDGTIGHVNASEIEPL